ncbi:MAG: undecaprenyl-diphosphate phosphatase [Planctomycetaceae bacterium]|nr:undecaprenyl-diphosphate phosphatase [Planctomycetaceae bacterium]
MENFLEVVLLGILQGIAEFLPISSSGHLNIAQAALKEFGTHALPDAMTVTIALHLGTLVSILVVYWQRIWRLLSTDRHVIGHVIVGTIPAGVVGVTLHELMKGLPVLKESFSSPLLAGCMLLVTGVMLIYTARRTPGDTDYTHMTYRQALIIGLVQAVAILPGISRSGSTIVGGLCVGLRRDAAATFSFLLAIPVTAGACLVEGKDLLFGPSPPESLPVLLAGAIVSFVVGIVALRWLIAWLQAGKLHHFAWWCIPLGILVIVWQCFSEAALSAVR